MKFKKAKEILLRFWILEKEGLGIKRKDFNCEVSIYAKNKFLRESRKKGKVYLNKRRYFLSDEYYRIKKQEIRNQ